MKCFFSLMTAGCLLFIAGCGYSASSSLPPRIKTIYIQDFANKINYSNESRRSIYFPLLEVKIKEAVVNRFQFDGHLRISDKENADLILQGELVGYNRIALRYTDNDDAQEYRIQVSVNLVMTDTENGVVFWSEDGFVGEADYLITGPQAKTESTAVEEATVDLARRIVERTIENW